MASDETFEDRPASLFEMLQLGAELFGAMVGKHVAILVDGARVEGTVTGFGTAEPDAAGNGGWTLAVDGEHYRVDRETIEAVAAADG